MKIFFKKFNKDKIKEVSLVGLSIILVGIGYVNFANKDDLVVETYAKSTNSLGDVELVNSNAILVENDDVNNNNMKLAGNINDINSNTLLEENGEVDNDNNEMMQVSKNENLVEEKTENKVESNNIPVSTTVENFSEIKLNRDIMYDEILETYQKIIDSTTISNEQKSIAVKEVENITKQKSSISVAEELIKLKGFEDVVILVNDDNVNVIIRIAHLTKAEVVQIQNIVMKELNVTAENISISTK